MGPSLLLHLAPPKLETLSIRSLRMIRLYCVHSRHLVAKYSTDVMLLKKGQQVGTIGGDGHPNRTVQQQRAKPCV